MIRDTTNTPDTLKTEITRLYNKKQLVIETVGLLPGITSEESNEWRNILELGCGSGAWTLAMAQRYRDKQVRGIDPDSLMITCKSENFVSGNLIIAWASKQPEKAAELQLAIVPVVTVLLPTELSNFRPRSLKIHTLLQKLDCARNCAF